MQAMTVTPAPLGEAPALLVIDVLYGFTGTRPMPIAEAIQEFPTSCGQRAWESLPHIRALIERFRDRDLPVIWVKPDPDAVRLYGRATRRNQHRPEPGNPMAHEIHELVAPRADERVVLKAKASAFFATPLQVMLNKLRIDSVVITGVSTSGCVRASAVDSYSWGYETFVVADACFDRSQISHDVSLFDIDAKYATVLETKDMLEALPTGSVTTNQPRGRR
jgi:maleamate amidohydrolase